MPRSQVVQVSFSAGELSPHLRDRVDLDAYYAGAAKMRNFVPLPHGPMVRRKGSTFIAEASSSKIRLIPFMFNLSQTFLLEFTPLKMRVIHDGGLVQKNDEILEVETPYDEEDLPNINFAQHGDWLYIVDGFHAPRAIKRYANDDWRVETLTFVNTPAEWSGDNYPKVIVLFEQRAYYMGTRKQPQQVWASRIGLYEEFTYKNSSGEAADDYAFTYTIFSNDVNGIVWGVNMGSLIVGTAGAEYKVSSTSAIDPITPKNIRISAQTHYGSAPVRPVAIGSNIVFAQRSRNRLRAFEYTFAEDQFTANDLTMFASHVLENQVIEMVVQTAPDSYIWAIDATGNMIGCTYEKQQKVLAWHRHDLGGKIKAICSLPTERNDEIWVAVEREANGGTRTYIEVLREAWEATTDIVEAFYVDSGLTYRGQATNSLVGLSHLNGKTVMILCDGWVHPPQVVANGQVKLQQKASVIHVGLPFDSEFISMIPQAQDQVTIGAVRRIYDATVALEESLDFKYSVDGDMWEIAYDGPTKVMNKALPLTSRHQAINIESKSAKTQQLYIKQDLPVPLIVSGIVYRLNPNKV